MLTEGGIRSLLAGKTFFTRDKEQMQSSAYRQIEQLIGYEFSDRALLDRAFTHSSAVSDRLHSNERLEFLGDSILGIVICQELFQRFQEYLEGDLTKSKSMLVSRRVCSKIVRQLGLAKFLKVGKGMITSRAMSSSLSAGLFEAVVAAVFLDGGFDAARKFVLQVFDSLIGQVQADDWHGNFKSLLQQHAQQHLNVTPVYEVLDEQGPEHNKCFEAQAVLKGRRFHSAWGTNKKEAEQKAAYNALVELGVLEKDVEGQ